MELLLHGGWALFPIFLASVATAALLWVKTRTLARAAAACPPDPGVLRDATEAVEAGDLEGAEAYCRASAAPLGPILAATVAIARRRPDRVEAEAQRAAEAELTPVLAHIEWLGLLAQVAPLLGLLGTVLGLVQLFAGLGAGGLQGVDVAQLSAGIWKALTTTAAGLVVAVPALVGQAALERRAETLRRRIEDALTRLINALPGELER